MLPHCTYNWVLVSVNVTNKLNGGYILFHCNWVCVYVHYWCLFDKTTRIRGPGTNQLTLQTYCEIPRDVEARIRKERKRQLCASYSFQWWLYGLERALTWQYSPCQPQPVQRRRFQRSLGNPCTAFPVYFFFKPLPQFTTKGSIEVIPLQNTKKYSEEDNLVLSVSQLKFWAFLVTWTKYGLVYGGLRQRTSNFR